MTIVSAVLAFAACTAPEESLETAPTPEPVWPDWAWTHWVWEDESTQESALALVDGYLERGIDVGAIIIDSPWATGYSTYEWDPALFPDPQGMVDELHAKGVKVFVWTVPAINVDAPGGLYEEAVDKGYFMLPREGGEVATVDWWKGDGSFIDYWNPEALDWWHGLVDQTLELGIDGWKTDGLDYQIFVTPYSPGAGRTIDRLEYSHAYYRDFHDYTREALGDDRIITARPVDNYGFGLTGEAVSFAPVDITWAGWVGDQDPTFEGLIAALDNEWASAEMGYLAFGADIGGYRTDTDLWPEHGRGKELFIRWAQHGAFSPVMENGGAGEHRPWMFDDETTDIYRDLVDLHHALLPYLTEAGAVAFAEERSLFTFLSRETYAYLLGPDSFVAPILEESGSVTVTFPEGEWVALYGDQATFQGGTTQSFTMGLSECPAYVRSGSELADTLSTP